MWDSRVFQTAMPGQDILNQAQERAQSLINAGWAQADQKKQQQKTLAQAEAKALEKFSLGQTDQGGSFARSMANWGVPLDMGKSAAPGDMSDADILARTLQAEAGKEGENGMLAAGSVIMNRARQNGFGGNTVEDVIMAPGQFSAWNSVTGYAGGEQGQDMRNMKPSPAAQRVAAVLLSGNYRDPTGGATHYYNDKISQPAWGQKPGEDWLRIGNHIFGRANK